mmetsp:Transcript_81406/g.228331  ORF Transcript_81406/g.228331 Transcript_81406/m.228331 type:complete len:807 (+) Transcript_81406:2-2422(+)
MAQADGLRALQMEHDRALVEVREESAQLRAENDRLRRRVAASLQDISKLESPGDFQREISGYSFADSSYRDTPAAKPAGFGLGECSVKASKTLVVCLDDACYGLAHRSLGSNKSGYPSEGDEATVLGGDHEQHARTRARSKTRPSWVATRAKVDAGSCNCCGQHLAPDSRFCRLCGAPAGSEGKRCACGTSVLSDSSFCRRCGAATGKDPRICSCGTMLMADGSFCRTCGTKWGGRVSAEACEELNMLPVWSMSPGLMERMRTRKGTRDLEETWKRVRKHVQVSRGFTTPMERRTWAWAMRPSSPARLVWDVATLVLVLYDAIMLPTAFLPYVEPKELDHIAFGLRVFWTVDFPLSFVCGFTRKDGSTEMSLPKIARHYAQTWMGLDICVIIIDWAVWALDASTQASSAARSVKVLRATRLARMLRMVRVYRLAVLSNKYMPALRYVTRSMGTRLALEIMKVLLGMLLVNHFIACLYHFMAYFPNGFEAHDADQPPKDTWLAAPSVRDLGVLETYIVAYHWAMTNFVGQGDANAVTLTERLFSIAVLFFAFLVLALVPPRITALMTSYQSANAENTTRYLQLTNYLQDNHISQRLAVRLQRAALSGLRLQRLRTPEASITLLGFVPQELRVELRWEMFSPHLLVHPLFCRVEEVMPVLARKLAYSGISTLEMAGEDVLFLAWEEPDPPVVFFVRSGTLSYAHGQGPRGSEVEVEKGSWLSEAALWTQWVHRGDAEAIQDTSLLLLSATVFQDDVVASEVFDQVRRYGGRFLARMKELDTQDVSDLVLWEAQEDVDIAFIDMVAAQF